jgi:hypothetical protein
LATANKLRTYGLVAFCIGGFEPGFEYPRTLKKLRIRNHRGILGIEASKSGIKVIERDQAFKQLLVLKERRIGLQAADQAVKIAVAVDFVVERNSAYGC